LDGLCYGIAEEKTNDIDEKSLRSATRQIFDNYKILKNCLTNQLVTAMVLAPQIMVKLQQMDFSLHW
jgi:hypothetical protein